MSIDASTPLMRRMRLASFLLAFVAILAGQAVGAEESPAASPNAFSIATFNINWGNIHLPKTAAAIRKAKADLVLLQETNAQSEAYLRSQLNGDYSTIAFQGGDRRYYAERFGFLLNKPIRQSKYLPAKHGLFGAWILETEFAGRKVQVVNVHLQPIVMPSRNGRRVTWLGGEQLAKLTGAIDAFLAMEDVHQKEIEYLCKNIKADLPTIVAGDFNSLSHMAAPRFLQSQGFTDSFASVNKEPDKQHTWHWPVGAIEVSGRIDYVFHTRHFRTFESSIVDSESSDHRLIVSRLAWQPEP